jgi:Tol biopolymer transport system component
MVINTPVPPALAARGTWESGDIRFFAVERICRDGLALSAVDGASSLSVLGQGSAAPQNTIAVGARLHTTAAALPVSGDPNSRLPAADYGPALAALTTFTLTVQTAPLAADTNNNGVHEAGEYFDVYVFQEHLYFSQGLTPGGTVVVTHAGLPANQELGYTSGVVEDCRLATFDTPRDSPGVVSSAVLTAGVMPAASVNYWVYALPANGALHQNGTALTVGQSFTQDDVSAGRITYLPAGGAAGFDRVRYGTAGTTRVSVSSAGAAGNGASREVAVSGDGRYVAFVSAAGNLVGDDNNTCVTFGGTVPEPCPDVFVRDVAAGTTTRVSVSSAGVQSNGESSQPAISADGRYVVFVSAATNLVAGDTNACAADGYTTPGTCPDVFVHDWQTGTTTRVSVGPGGAQANRQVGRPAISADGRYVAFVSEATTLALNDTNGFADVFVRDLAGSTTVRVSVSTAGVQQNDGSASAAISAAGRFVAFDSFADNLLDGALDGNTGSDIFLRDRDTDGDGVLDEPGAVSTSRVSLRDGGLAEANGSGGGSFLPAVSADGRYVAFRSYSTDLVSGDAINAGDIFLRDRQAHTTRRVSVNAIGQEVNGFSFDSPALSADGRFVAFLDSSNALGAGDSNVAPDIFVYDRETGAVRLASASSAGTLGNNGSTGPAISADGRYVSFTSFADNLVANDDNATADVFLRYVERYETLGIVVRHRLYAPLIRR